MKNINRIICGMLLTMSIASCGDKWEIVKDNRPDIPVTFDGATTVGFNPYYTVSYAANAFTITLSIPSTQSIK